MVYLALVSLPTHGLILEVEYFDHNDSKVINAWIPHECVVRYLLFLIYINDLPKFIKELCKLFANDISILTSGQNNSNLMKN